MLGVVSYTMILSGSATICEKRERATKDATEITSVLRATVSDAAINIEYLVQ